MRSAIARCHALLSSKQYNSSSWQPQQGSALSLSRFPLPSSSSPLRVEWWKLVVIDSGELSYKVLSEHLLVETATVNDTWVVGHKLLHDQE